jgi:hypothetical protein
VDSVSGQPVPHALVKVSGDPSRATLTDSEGKFQFEALPAGSVILEAEKPGFLAQDPVAKWYPTNAQLQLAPDTPSALLKLIPEGVIFGQVSDETGEPLESFTVSILSRGPQGKRLHPDPSHTAVTNDEGKFRIAGLHPGSYFLLIRQAQTPAQAASGKAPVPSGYSPVFYPGSSEPASASPIKLLPGRTVQANFSLKREPFIRLSGTVSGYTPQEHVFLMLQDSSGPPQNSEVIFDNATSSFHTKWIPPGTYTLIAVSAITGVDTSSTISFASLHMNATSNLSNLRLVLQPTTSMLANVRIRSSGNSGEQQPSSVQLFLVPKDTHFMNRAIPFVPSQPPGNSEFSSDSTGVFSSVPSGTFELSFAIDAPSSSYYLDSATWGSVDLLRDDLILDSSGAAPPIEVVLRDDAATLNGSVALGDPPAEATVVVLSDKRKPRFLSVGSTGKFIFSALPPGVYRLFAVDSSANFDYQDPTFLSKISSRIQEITLTPKQSASVNLELATVEE